MDESERERIQAAGGFVIFGRVGGTLAVSRAFGDRPFKAPYSRTPADLVTGKHEFFLSSSSLFRRFSFINTFIIRFVSFNYACFFTS